MIMYTTNNDTVQLVESSLSLCSFSQYGFMFFESQRMVSAYLSRSPTSTHERHQHHCSSCKNCSYGDTGATLPQTTRDKIWTSLVSQCQGMKHAGCNVHRVDGAGERGERENSVEKVSGCGNSSFDNGNDEYGVGANRLASAIDERVVCGNHEGACKHCEAVQGYDPERDLSRRHFHAFCIR